MKSRVRPTYKAHYRVGNWRVYERALVSRGDVALWILPYARGDVASVMADVAYGTVAFYEAGDVRGRTSA